MSTDTFSTLAAIATLLALVIAAVAVAGLVRSTILDRLGPVATLIRTRPLWLGGAIATAAMLGSLYYSEVADFVPCDYCWYQRIAMYPLAFILLIAAIRRDRGAMWTALPISLIGLGIAVYHYQLQLFPEQSNACNVFAPCTQQWVDTWGFISIPFMAGAGFLAIAALAALTIRDDRRALGGGRGATGSEATRSEATEQEATAGDHDDHTHAGAETSAVVPS